MPKTLGADARYEFLAGSDFLVAPVYKDSDTRDGIYLPKGTWTDYWTGRTYRGPTTVDGYHAPLDTLPLFVKGGSIVPMWPKGTTSWKTRDRNELDWDLYPKGDSGYTLYEDDGVTRHFAEGASATQRVTVAARRTATTVDVGASRGVTRTSRLSRAYRFTVHGEPAPRRVLLDGHPLPRTSWSYDSGTGVTTVSTPRLTLDRGSPCVWSGRRVGQRPGRPVACCAARRTGAFCAPYPRYPPSRWTSSKKTRPIVSV